jgi:hypothetical protein
MQQSGSSSSSNGGSVLLMKEPIKVVACSGLLTLAVAVINKGSCKTQRTEQRASRWKMEAVGLASHQCCSAFHRKEDELILQGRVSCCWFLSEFKFIWKLAALGRNWIRLGWVWYWEMDGLVRQQQLFSWRWSLWFEIDFCPLLELQLMPLFSVEMLVRRILKCPQLHFSLVFPLS